MSKLSDDDIRRIAEAVRRHDGNISRAAAETGFNWHTTNRYGHQPVNEGPPPAERLAKMASQPKPDPQAVIAAMRKGPVSVAEVAKALNGSEGYALSWLDGLLNEGHNLKWQDYGFRILPHAPAGNRHGQTFEYVSRPDNTFVFGACGDQHYASKYCRHDVIESYYDEFEASAVDRAFNTGNWIDGEAPFNTYDLDVHGLDAQLLHLAQHYPRRDGISTYAISGLDHEGWYNKKNGMEVGIYGEAVMRRQGRTDWHHLGLAQAFVKLVNANTGKSAMLCVMHPGGGSSYAVSYKPQKIVESFSGGNKPAVLLIGHYHKLSVNNIRNVWAIQTGAGQDRTPFQFQKLIEPHVGACIVELRQDPQTGAIVRCKVDMLRYFDRGYYDNVLSTSGTVTQAERMLNQ